MHHDVYKYGLVYLLYGTIHQKDEYFGYVEQTKGSPSLGW
jgi:hypothetical protein